jgi:mono/diheme cytochrome c family protein
MRGLLILAASAFWLTDAAAQEAGDPEAGHTFARSICAACHAVEPGELASPNLLAPTFTTIANVPGMTMMALTVVLSNPHREMPDLVLARDELRDVAAYILTLKDAD